MKNLHSAKENYVIWSILLAKEGFKVKAISRLPAINVSLFDVFLFANFSTNHLQPTEDLTP